MFTYVLAAHVITAVLMGGVALRASYRFFGTNADKLAKDALLLCYIAFFEMWTGSIMGLLANDLQIGAFCRNFALYVSVFLVLELAIAFKLRRLKSDRFPFESMWYSTGFSFASAAVVVFMHTPGV